MAISPRWFKFHESDSSGLTVEIAVVFVSPDFSRSEKSSRGDASNRRTCLFLRKKSQFQQVGYSRFAATCREKRSSFYWTRFYRQFQGVFSNSFLIHDFTNRIRGNKSWIPCFIILFHEISCIIKLYSFNVLTGFILVRLFCSFLSADPGLIKFFHDSLTRKRLVQNTLLKKMLHFFKVSTIL